MSNDHYTQHRWLCTIVFKFHPALAIWWYKRAFNSSFVPLVL